MMKRKNLSAGRSRIFTVRSRWWGMAVEDTAGWRNA
jgi:hypothetical protein